MIELKLCKTTVILTEAEFMKVLSRDPELFKLSILRGKHTLRQRKAESRQVKMKEKAHV